MIRPLPFCRLLMCSCIPGYNPVGPLCLSSFPVDDGADEHVAEDADHEDDGLEERAHDGVVEGVVLGVLAPGIALDGVGPFIIPVISRLCVLLYG